MKIEPKKNRSPEPPPKPDSTEVPGRETAHRKGRRLKHIAFLPSFITLINGACGFIAILFASDNYFTMAAYIILLAMVADVLDGRVARLTRTTSSFGGQLDSLSDAVSFGVAPAFIMIKLVELHLGQLGFEDLGLPMLLGRVIILSAVLYAMCAVVRLARFNVENEEDEAAHMNFAGLPSPAAAGVVVSLVLFHQQILPGLVDQGTMVFHIATVAALPLVTILAGILMVSRIRYPHVANQLLRSKKSLGFLLAIFAAVLLIVWNIQFALLLGFCGYALFGVMRWIVSLFRKPQNKAVPDAGTGGNQL